MLALVAAAATAVAWRGARREVAHAGMWMGGGEAGLRVGRMRPSPGSRDVLPLVSVALDLALSDPDENVGIDPRSLASGVRLLGEDGRAVASHANTSGAGDLIVLTPASPLRAGERFTVETTSALSDTLGRPIVPFRGSFTVSSTARPVEFPAAFEKVPLGVESGSAFTAITIGPDERLYAATFDGRILQFDIRPDGTLSQRWVIDAVIRANGGPRMIVGLAFDPRATPDTPRLWVSHGQMVPMVDGAIQGAEDWTGKLGVVEGEQFERYRDRVMGLPRAFKDHLNFQPSFGPDGAIYFGQGSQTGTGAPDAKWGMRPERMLSAAILRLDPARLPADGPLDVRTSDGGGVYDPDAAGAALRVYASGVRCAYDVLWHSSGRFYAALNGASSGGATPGAPPRGGRPGVQAIASLDHVTDDVLIEVDPRAAKPAYFGAPNPARGEFILNGGNPTAGVDPYEVPRYPVGTLPEPNWRRPVFNFGKNISPNGMVEYPMPGPLNGAILVARYSAGDDIVALLMDASGVVTGEVTGIDGFGGFTDPLDLAVDPRTGNLYVAEFGGQRLTLLRSREGVSQVYLRAARSGD